MIRTSTTIAFQEMVRIFVQLARRSIGEIGDLWNVIDRFFGASCGHVIGYGLFLIETKKLGIGSNESLVEDAAGEQVEFLVLDGLEHPGADFGGGRNLVQRDATQLALTAQFFAKTGQRASCDW